MFLIIKLEKTEYVKQNSLKFSFHLLFSVFLHLKLVTRQQHRGGKCQSYLVNTHLFKALRLTSTEERTRVTKIGKCRRQILNKAIDQNPSHICWKCTSCTYRKSCQIIRPRFSCVCIKVESSLRVASTTWLIVQRVISTGLLIHVNPSDLLR